MKININASVGKQGANLANDVKLIQATINTYLRSTKQDCVAVDGDCGDKTIGAITAFQSKVVKLAAPDGRIDPGGTSLKKLKTTYENALKDGKPLAKPEVGIVTFDSEGMEGGPYHSRILHVPGAWSGVTLGRGYDMGSKSAAKISAELVSAGISSKHSQKISMAHGLKGVAAKQFIINNDLLDFQITPLEQVKLFTISYNEESNETERICKRSAYEKQYGTCNWDKLDPRIKEILIDLKFRGDYKPSTAKHIQEHIANNDFDAFKNAMLNASYWENVPKDRFTRRVNFLKGISN
ncbi:MAG: pesticin C-terminus-like muramidase [Gammaproteobacteria bacterium]|nr:pesticin C-terminus-like muramidase [Gammaproteobacteria bacterium]